MSGRARAHDARKDEASVEAVLRTLQLIDPLIWAPAKKAAAYRWCIYSGATQHQRHKQDGGKRKK